MYVRLLMLAALFAVAAAPGWAQAPDQPEPKYPEVGSLIPGPLFKVLNVTGERKARYHCLVCGLALNPVAAVFVQLRQDDKEPIDEALKKIDPDQPLAKLFKKLDTHIDKNLDTKTGGFAVFLVHNDKDKAEEFQTAKKLQTLEKAEKLKRFVLAVTEEKQNGYMDGEFEVIVLLYHNHRVKSYRKYTKENPLTEKDVDAIEADFLKVVPKKPKRKLKF